MAARRIQEDATFSQAADAQGGQIGAEGYNAVHKSRLELCAPRESVLGRSKAEWRDSRMHEVVATHEFAGSTEH